VFNLLQAPEFGVRAQPSPPCSATAMPTCLPVQEHTFADFGFVKAIAEKLPHRRQISRQVKAWLTTDESSTVRPQPRPKAPSPGLRPPSSHRMGEGRGEGTLQVFAKNA